MLAGKRVNLGEFGLLVLAGMAGGMVARMHTPQVHAQEKFSEIGNCVTVVPKYWGEYKGASEYGLAFQDEKGTLRFLLHPTCGSPNSPAEPPPAPIDLEVLRR